MKCTNPRCGNYSFCQKKCPVCGSKMKEVKQRNFGVYHRTAQGIVKG